MEPTPRPTATRPAPDERAGARAGADRPAAGLLCWRSGRSSIVALLIWPDLRNYLPVGGVEQLISQPQKNPLEANEAIRAEHVGNLGQSLFWLAVAIIGALLCSLPVSRVYMAVRSGAEYDQSLVNTIIMLPMVVTGIVIIVQNSLALAFALAGIAGAVRFRNSLKSSGDALFILCSVAIGLSARDRRGRAGRGDQRRLQLHLRDPVADRIWRAQGHEALSRRL